MITKLLTSLVTRDVEAFVTFVERLRDKLDALVVRHASDIGRVQAYIDELEEYAEKKIARLKIDSDSAIQDVRDYTNHEILLAETEISKIKAKIERVKAATSAVSAL
jgi:hypothetical protein